MATLGKMVVEFKPLRANCSGHVTRRGPINQTFVTSLMEEFFGAERMILHERRCYAVLRATY